MRVAALIGFLICAAWAQDSSPEQLFRDAVDAQQHGDYERAVQKYQELIALRPDVLEARANLGAALAHLGRFDEAIAQYESALASHPNQIQIRMNLALAYYKTGRIGQAAAQFATLHADAPSEKRVTLLLADCWLQQDENKKVIDLLGPLDVEYHDDLAFSYLYGVALIRTDQLDLGQQVMDRILRNGDSAEARVLMANTRIRRLDNIGARADLERALELNPTLPGVHSTLGTVLEVLKDGGANDAFRKELEINPNDFTANLYLGVAALHDLQLEQADSYLRRSLAVRPHDPTAMIELAHLLSAQGKLDDACRVLEDLVRISPDFREAHVLLATTYYRLHRKADGDAERTVIQKLNPQKDPNPAHH